MTLGKLKTIVIGVVVVTGVVVSLVIHSRSEVASTTKLEELHQQDDQLAELAVEHKRLSVAVTQSKQSPPKDLSDELQKLRNEAETLKGLIRELETKTDRRSPTAF